MKTTNILGLVLLLSILLGCATAGHKISENLTSLPQTKGLVLFSTGASETRISFSTILRLVEGSSRKQYDNVYINIDAPYASHFAGEHVIVRTLLLPAGDYYLLPEILNPFVWKNDPFINFLDEEPVYKFTVKNNRVTYIGNFWLSGHRLTWSDSKLNRDKSFFLLKNPGMANVPMELHTPEVVSDVLRFEVRGIIFGIP